MNETRQHEPRTPDGQLTETQAAENQSLAGQKSRQDRIFGYSTVASILVTFGWLAWVSNSNLFGSAASLADLNPKLIKIVKPPIPQKPKPKKKEPPPPPPKHQPPPKVKPLKPPPRPRPTPPRPTPLHRVAVATTHNTHAVSPLVAPPTEPNPNVGTPTASGESPQPTPPAPTPQPPAPTPAPPAPDPTPAPAPPPPAPPPPRPTPPPPKPEPPPRPRNYSPIDSQEAGPIGDYASVDMPSGVDTSQLSSTSVTVSYEIDENGRASGIRVTKGSGNADLDDACKEAIRRTRFKPAIQDHLKLRQPASYTFSVG